MIKKEELRIIRDTLIDVVTKILIVEDANMSKNRSSLFKAVLAISLMLFVVAFVVIKSGAIEPRVTTTTVNGVEKISKTYSFNAGKIPAYLKGVVAPITGAKAIPQD